MRRLLAIALTLGATVLAPSTASAEIGEELFRFGSFGSGAGELRFLGTGGIATDPESGHVFVSDAINYRISEFTAWGEFVKAWGWGVRDGSTELQTCTEQTGCQEGLEGAGAGQMSTPTGIAVDAAGNVYVFDSPLTGAGLTPKRMQKFSPEGEFLWMVGGGVNQTTGADICTKADQEAGDVCAGGEKGTGPGEFSRQENASSRRDVVDVSPSGKLYVLDRGRIQVFALNGSFEEEIPFSAMDAQDPSFPQNLEASGISIDPASEDLFIAFASQSSDSSTWRVRSDGILVKPAPLVSTAGPSNRFFSEAVAADLQGGAYAAIDPVFPTSSGHSLEPRVVQLDAEGTKTGECCVSPIFGSTNDGFVILPALAANKVTAAGGVDLYVAYGRKDGDIVEEAFIEVRGPAPDKWPPPLADPAIEAQFATTVRSESAVVKAEINPNFWADTRYRLQLGTSDCSLGGCEEVIEEPGTLLGAGVVKRAVATEGIALTDLKPGTTYHYRFVAESSGGGPVFGPNRTFTTFELPKPVSQTCPNAELRTGSSSALADCRAYEMVSPTDKAGGDILVMGNINGTPTGLRQATPDGQKITYTSYRSFADAESASYSVQYVASRGEDGWSTDNVSPPRDSGELQGVAGLDSQYKAFLEDLSVGWIVATSDPILDEGAVPGQPNLYRRDQASETYDALTTVTPLGLGSQPYNPEPQGFSADGSHTVFRANAKLTKPALAGETFQVYESFEGSLRLVSVKDDGKAATATSTLGAIVVSFNNGREANVRNAISDDGSTIYWGEVAGTGKLYVRVDGTQTFAVSSGAATYWAAKPNGSQALYTEAGALKLYDLASKGSTTLVGSGVEGVVGSSEDLSRIYLVSTADLAEGAVAGKPNLYLHEEGETPRLIGTLRDGEVSLVPKAFSPIAISPRQHAATTTADASTLIFMSRAPLTGADNAELSSEESVSQVFRYDAEADELACISCNPTGARPVGYEPEIDGHPRDYWVSGLIPGGEFQNHFPRSLSADGDRVFFESTDRLTISDTNGKTDVYAWEAPGKGECTPEAPGYNPNAGGCVTLISDGQGASGSELVDASSDGASVFFTTAVGLLPQDPGQVDLYAASEDGGFPQPPPPPAPCEGEACQPAATPPPASPFSSQTFVGPGNPPARKPTRRCRKGTVRKRGKCVRKGQGASKSSRSSRNSKRYEARRANGRRE